MQEPVFEPFRKPFAYSAEEMLEKARAFRDAMRKRRTVRDYDSRSIPEGVLEACLEAAATAPSGANKQPWHFVVVKDAGLRAKIREEAEKEERAFYSERAPREWLEALRALGTDEHKPFLETAPVLIAIFAETYEIRENGSRKKNYYVQESVGIATGMLITALHLSGLSTLTHTPSPMGFLNAILDRPSNERAYLLLVVGFPADTATVPKISKKDLSDYVTLH